MIDINQLKKDIKDKFKHDHHRYQHIMGVYETALAFATHYNVSLYDAAVASLAHDLMKNESREKQTSYLSQSDIDAYQKTPVMYHALSAAEVLKKEYHVSHNDILEAVRYHVWGKPNMTTLGKIIFISDYCEPNRTFTDIKIIRDLAYENLDQAVLYCMKLTIDEVREKKREPHPDQWLAYTYYLEVKHGKTQ
ncbi:MAG: bis(5'-nucleosyl)-tetraphosphatase (symmetrical) YqeK [Acholeplasmataceae bacterium]